MLRGTIFLSASQVVFVATNFLLHAFLGRRLGPAMYGIYGVINTLIVVNEFILLKGSFETLSKFVAEKENAAKTIIRSVLKFIAPAGIVMGALYYLLAGKLAGLMNDPALAEYIRLFAFMVPLAAVSTVFLGGLNGQRQFGKQALVSITFSVGRLLFVAALVISGLSVMGAITGLLLAEILRMAVAGRVCRPTGETDRIESREMFQFGLQLTIVAVIASLVMNIDLLAVKAIMRDNLQTGLYTSAVTVAKIGLFLMVPISMTVLPTVSRSIAEGDAAGTEKLIEQALKLVLILVLPLSLIVMATSENCLALFYGARYTEAARPLVILMISGVFLSVKVVLYNVIIASGRPRFVVIVGLCSLVMDIFLLVVLIRGAGLLGAAYASAATHLMGLLAAYAYVARKFLSRSLPLFLLRIVSGAAATGVLAMFFSPRGVTLLLYYMALMITFFLLLMLLGEASPAWVMSRTVKAVGDLRTALGKGEGN